MCASFSLTTSLKTPLRGDNAESCKILAGRWRQAGNINVSTAEGHWRNPACIRFKPGKSRFLHVKSTMEFNATGCGEYYQSPLVQREMGIKTLRWLLTTKTLSLRQVQGSQVTNHWKLWKHKYKLILFLCSS